MVPDTQIFAAFAGKQKYAHAYNLEHCIESAERVIELANKFIARARDFEGHVDTAEEAGDAGCSLSAKASFVVMAAADLQGATAWMRGEAAIYESAEMDLKYYEKLRECDAAMREGRSA